MCSFSFSKYCDEKIVYCLKSSMPLPLLYQQLVLHVVLCFCRVIETQFLTNQRHIFYGLFPFVVSEEPMPKTSIVFIVHFPRLQYWKMKHYLTVSPNRSFGVVCQVFSICKT